MATKLVFAAALIAIAFALGCSNRLDGHWVGTVEGPPKSTISLQLNSDHSFELTDFKWKGTWEEDGDVLTLFPSAKNRALELIQYGHAFPDARVHPLTLKRLEGGLAWKTARGTVKLTKES